MQRELRSARGPHAPLSPPTRTTSAPANAMPGTHAPEELGQLRARAGGAPHKLLQLLAQLHLLGEGVFAAACLLLRVAQGGVAFSSSELD